MAFTYIKAAAFVLLSVMLFGGGHLSSITLATLTASQFGVSDFGVGLLTSLTFFGLFAGSIVMPRLLRRTRHVRLIALGTAACALSLIFLPVINSLLVWSLLRFTYGFSAAAVWLCCDVWMANLAPPEQRGKTLAFYQVTVLSGTALGQVLLATTGDHIELGFSIATATMIAAVIPICCTKLAEPEVESKSRKLTLQNVWSLSRLSLVGSLVAGLCFSNYSFILLNFSNQGATPNQIALAGTLVIASGVLGQFLMGFLSDRYRQRRYLLQGAALLAMASLIGCAFSGLEFWPLTLFFACLYGGLVVPIYPLCVAIGGSLASKKNFSALAAKHFLAICAGNALGPLLGGIVLHFFPTYGTYIFVCTALVLLFVACSSEVMLTRHQPARQEEFSPMATIGANPEFSDPRSLAKTPAHRQNRPSDAND